MYIKKLWSTLEFERGFWVGDLGSSSIVDEPIKLTGEDGFDAGGGQTLLGVIEDISDHISLFLACCDENDSGGMVYDREGKGDSPRGWFGRVVNVSNPSVFFCEELMTGKEGCGVAVRAHTEENEVEDGEACCVFLCKLADEFLLIRIGELLEVIKECGIDGVDIGEGDGNI